MLPLPHFALAACPTRPPGSTDLVLGFLSVLVPRDPARRGLCVCALPPFGPECGVRAAGGSGLDVFGYSPSPDRVIFPLFGIVVTRQRYITTTGPAVLGDSSNAHPCTRLPVVTTTNPQHTQSNTRHVRHVAHTTATDGCRRSFRPPNAPIADRIVQPLWCENAGNAVRVAGPALDTSIDRA